MTQILRLTKEILETGKIKYTDQIGYVYEESSLDGKKILTSKLYSYLVEGVELTDVPGEVDFIVTPFEPVTLAIKAFYNMIAVLSDMKERTEGGYAYCPSGKRIIEIKAKSERAKPDSFKLYVYSLEEERMLVHEVFECLDAVNKVEEVISAL